MRSKPARWTPPAAEQPRSSSITSISDKSSSAGDSAWHIATHCSHGCAEPDALTIAGVEQRLAFQMVGADLVRDHDQVCLGDPGRFAPACPNISCTIRPVSVARVSADSSSHAGVATVTPRRFAAKQVELLRGARQIAHPLDPAFPSADRHGLLFDSDRRSRDTPETGSFNEVDGSRSACHRRSRNADKAAAPTLGAAVSRTAAQTVRSNIQAGISTERPVSEPVSVQRKTRSLDVPIVS